jgi:hypothetical protein
MFARGLLELALATGDVNYAIAGRSLVDSTLAEGQGVFRTPNGADPVLASQGMGVDIDPSEGAYPSGLTATAEAAYALYSLTGERRYLDAAMAGMGLIADLAPSRPLAFGAALHLIDRMIKPARQLVIVSPRAEGTGEPLDEQESDLVDAARREIDGVVASVTAGQSRAFADAGFELFVGREPQSGLATAYFCSDFVCRLPVTDAVNMARAKSKSDEAHRTVH